jgi:DNA-binding IclR family transcriptional regulator
MALSERYMAYTYHELKLKTIADLREIAKGLDHEAVQGYSQMNKEHLLPALCKALGIDTHEHHDAVGIDKPAIKAKVRELKVLRAAALEAHDHEKLKAVRRHIHSLNRQIRAHLQ